MDKEMEKILLRNIDDIVVKTKENKITLDSIKHLEVGEFGNQTIIQLFQVKQMVKDGVISQEEAERASEILIGNYCVSGYQSGALSLQEAEAWRARLNRIAGVHWDEEPEK